jgi:hypothetical protein
MGLIDLGLHRVVVGQICLLGLIRRLLNIGWIQRGHLLLRL